MEQNLIFEKKFFFAHRFLKMCPYSPKKTDFSTFSKHDSDHLGTAPTLGRWCRPSFRVVQTFFKTCIFGVIRAYFLKMFENDPKWDDFEKVCKDDKVDLDIAPTLLTC